ncbi:MAG: T9SS type A sorting domain-containing protein, partial [Planctomycetes bacterium]|nr:T9SS type A sorting domain-containing protein [Planctomycetota bacterium]
MSIIPPLRLGDGVGDACDNCPMIFNPDQANADAEGIIAAWRFDEGNGITAFDSVGSIDGTLSGATYVSDGLGYVLDFDGDNDLDVFVLGRSFIGTPFSKLYRNDSRLINRPPQPPDGLSSTVNADNVTLSWNAGDDVETGIAGLMYNVSVGTAPGASDIFSARANTTTGKRWIFGPGNVGHNLSWTLHNLPIGLYFWSVQTIDNSYIGSEFSEEGQFSVSTGGKISTGTDDKVDLPQDFMLHPAYPNPMRTTTTLVFDIPVSTAVEITIFDILGKRIKTLVNGYLPGGIHRIDWEGDSESGHALGSGVFFVRMRAGEQVLTQKLVLLKWK